MRINSIKIKINNNAIYNGRLVIPEKPEKCSNVKSYTYSKKNNNLYFMPEQRRKQLFIFLEHLESLNNMIRHFQEMYFHDNYYQTVPSGGYDNPDFEKLSKAYGFDYKQIKETDDNISFDIDKPTFIEVVLNDKTYVFPNGISCILMMQLKHYDC